MRARYYQPSTGRFLTEDPIRSELNYYTYCSNNPVRFIDPSGLLTVKKEDILMAKVDKNGNVISTRPATDEDYYKWAVSIARSSIEKNTSATFVSYFDQTMDFVNQMDDLRNQLAWETRLKSIYTTQDALYKIFSRDTSISFASAQTNVPKTMIQSILFRELICTGLDDIAADMAVKAGIRSDSSTGWGQIFAQTAITAYNPNSLSISQMWNLLQDTDVNIGYVGYVLRYEAGRQGITDLYAITAQQRINIFGAYNAGSNYATAGARYGAATETYFNAFEQYRNRTPTGYFDASGRRL